jgi:hypothetical protein
MDDVETHECGIEWSSRVLGTIYQGSLQLGKTLEIGRGFGMIACWKRLRRSLKHESREMKRRRTYFLNVRHGNGSKGNS